MTDFGELLYEGKTDSSKNSYGFFIVGIILFVGSNFIYQKSMLMIFGGVAILIGLYLLIFKRNEKISIYENAIILILGGKELVINKEEINKIDYHEVKVRRSPVVNYYPILMLKNENQVLINKVFNSTFNKDFEKIIKSYI